jgi:hypothetical protein
MRVNALDAFASPFRPALPVDASFLKGSALRSFSNSFLRASPTPGVVHFEVLLVFSRVPESVSDPSQLAQIAVHHRSRPRQPACRSAIVVVDVGGPRRVSFLRAARLLKYQCHRWTKTCLSFVSSHPLPCYRDFEIFCVQPRVEHALQYDLPTRRSSVDVSSVLRN